MLAAVVIAALVAGVVLLSRSRESDEARLRRQLQEIADAASRRDVSEVVEHVSERFSSPRGRIDRQGLKRLLLGVLLREAWSKVFLLEPEITRREDGSFDVDVVFVGAQGAELPDDVRELPITRARAFRITGRFVDEEGELRVIEADWAEASAADLLPRP